VALKERRMTARTYTYQGKRKLPLSWPTTHFISRATKRDLVEHHFQPFEIEPPRAWRVRTNGDKLEEDIRRARGLAVAHPAYVNGENGSSFRVSDRIFVRFLHASDATGNALHEFAVKYRLAFVEQFSDCDVLFRIDAADDPVDVVCRLTEDEDAVEVADHDLNIEPKLSSTPDTPYAAQQWYLLSEPIPHARNISPTALVKCVDAWKVAGMGSSEVVIAVIDCGFNLSDPNFADGKFAGSARFTDGELKTGLLPHEMGSYNSHGTKCATLAAASANNVGGIGAAPDCRLLPVKWDRLDGVADSQSSFIKIIDHLCANADVVSCSWNICNDWPFVIADRLRKVASNGGRRGAGMIWCWSAGNENHPIHYESDIPVPVYVETDQPSLRKFVRHVSKTFRNSFATVPNVLHIGAISSGARRCHYSNYGPGLELVAPSDNWHTYHRTDFADAPMNAPLARGLTKFGGTSAAAPLVAGIAALVLSANRDLKARDVVRILRSTADHDEQGFDMTPYDKCGLPGDEPDADWDVSPVRPFHKGGFSRKLPDGPWSPWFGFGKVNALKAVCEAKRRRAAHP
jgi:hypothetical protein